MLCRDAVEGEAIGTERLCCNDREGSVMLVCQVDIGAMRKVINVPFKIVRQLLISSVLFCGVSSG